jgi:hypothetical protein
MLISKPYHQASGKPHDRGQISASRSGSPKIREGVKSPIRSPPLRTGRLPQCRDMRVDFHSFSEGKGYLVLARGNLHQSTSAMQSKTSALKSPGKAIDDLYAALDVRNPDQNSTFTASSGAHGAIRVGSGPSERSGRRHDCGMDIMKRLDWLYHVFHR